MHYENLPFFALLNKKTQLRVTPGKKTKINNDETFMFSLYEFMSLLIISILVL
jgi:hypothetical protein